MRVLGASGKERISKLVATGLAAAVKQLDSTDQLLDQVFSNWLTIGATLSNIMLFAAHSVLSLN